jgi:ubiquinone/menaquinone biosynthesis C-methylase UbiE
MSNLEIYEELATDYYKPGIHFCQKNFRMASELLLKDILENHLILPNGEMLEVGAGDSLLADYLQKYSPRRMSDLLITDISAGMLIHSKKYLQYGARIHLSPAEDLPVDNHSIDFLLASLGDCYNNSQFWQEASRVITANGYILITLPSFAWVSCFRHMQPRSEFVINQKKYTVPSFVYDQENQQQLLSTYGLTIKQLFQIRKQDLTKIQGKTLNCLIDDQAVVDGYLIKPG